MFYLAAVRRLDQGSAHDFLANARVNIAVQAADPQLPNPSGHVRSSRWAWIVKSISGVPGSE